MTKPNKHDVGIIDPRTGRFHPNSSGKVRDALATAQGHVVKEGGKPVSVATRNRDTGEVRTLGQVRPASNTMARGATSNV